MKIAIIGSGYVGLVAAACFAELSNDVVCVDNDAQKIAALERGDVPIHEPRLPELLARHRSGRLSFSASISDAVRASEVIFIAVGTPSAESGEADLSYVEAVAREIAQALDGYKVIVEKSTVPVYTCEWIRRVIAMNSSGQHPFDVVSNPEFLREGTAVSDFFSPDRIVIGADSDKAAELLRTLYAPLISGEYAARPDSLVVQRTDTPPPLVVTSSKSAELIKHASNAFLAMKISFINAVANLCESVGADVTQVRDGIGLDSRIGMRFLNPGLGYGGSCFPKDLKAFRAVAEERGYDFGLLTETIKINEEQQRRFLKKVRGALWTLRGKLLAVLGLAFKGGTDDVRESPAIAIVQALVKEGCLITAYDPAAIERARQVLGATISYATNPYEAATNADAVLILTDWPDFAALDLRRLAAIVKHRLIIDGRNLFDLTTVAAAGFTYVSVGRPTASPGEEQPAATEAKFSAAQQRVASSNTSPTHAFYAAAKE
jgi:UDPglucose 6-dehydrogenase